MAGVRPGSYHKLVPFVNAGLYIQTCDETIWAHPQAVVLLARAQAGGVAHEVHAVHGAREEHVDAVDDAQEPEVAPVVAAHQRDDHHFALLALEVVDGGEAHPLVQRGILLPGLVKNQLKRFFVKQICFFEEFSTPPFGIR